MAEEYAFSTDNPATLAAYRETRAAAKEFAARLKADCDNLGVAGAYVRRGVWGSPDEINALGPGESGAVPDGWRMVRDQLEPRRGKPGDAARQWLADHQPPDVRHVMTKHGLPRHSSMPSGTGGYRMSAPALFEHDGTLWACYEGKPGGPFDSDDGPCTWTPRKLSEFHTVREAAEAADDAEKAVA